MQANYINVLECYRTPEKQFLAATVPLGRAERDRDRVRVIGRDAQVAWRARRRGGQCPRPLAFRTPRGRRRVVAHEADAKRVRRVRRKTVKILKFYKKKLRFIRVSPLHQRPKSK